MENQYVLKPNNSLNLRAYYLTAALVGLSVALLSLRFVFMGLWLIIPFVIFYTGLLLWSMKLMQRRAALREIITIDSENLSITHRTPAENNRWLFKLVWVQIKLQLSVHPWCDSRLLIGSHGRWIVLGEFLTNQERSSLARELRLAISNRKYS